jgi:plastocyanin
MIPTGAASALSVLAAAPSKVPFYIAGGALAVWAVVLAALGITRPGFPGSRAGRRGVVAASALLVVTTMTAAVATAGEEGEGEAAATSAVFDLAADPSGATAYDRKTGLVKAGGVTIHLTNESGEEHNVAVGEGSRVLAESDTVKRGSTDLKVDLQPGEYPFFCEIDAHRAAGMEGTLTVR